MNVLDLKLTSSFAGTAPTATAPHNRGGKCRSGSRELGRSKGFDRGGRSRLGRGGCRDSRGGCERSKGKGTIGRKGSDGRVYDWGASSTTHMQEARKIGAQ